MTTRYLLLLPALLLIFSSACKKKGNDGPTGPAGPAGPSRPVYYGVIAGHVSVYDEYGIQLYRNLDGIQVRLNDSTSTLTDTNGYYVFDSVMTGNYDISWSKTGLGGTMAYNTAFVKDTLFKNMGMSILPDFDATSFAAYYDSTAKTNYLSATFNGDRRAKNGIIFVSNNRSVSSSNYLLAYVKPIVFTSSAGMTQTIRSADLNDAGIAHNTLAYYAVYSYVVNDVSAYDERGSGRRIYTAVGKPLLDSVIVP